jgi:hypothetical protein
MTVGVLGMSVAMLTMVVSRRRVLLGFFMLSVLMMVCCHQVMVRGGMMVCGGLPVMLDRRMFGLFCHGLVLPLGFGCGMMGALRAQRWPSINPPVSERAEAPIAQRLRQARSG